MAQGLQAITVNSRQGLFSTPLKRMGTFNGCLGEAATSTWAIGAPLVNSSGYLAEAGTNPTAVVGFATAAATGVTGADVEYIPAYTDTLEFEISIDTGGSIGTGSLANTNVMSTFGLTRDSTSKFWFADTAKTATTYINVRLMGFKLSPGATTSDVGVIQGRGIFILVRNSASTPDGTIYY